MSQSTPALAVWMTRSRPPPLPSRSSSGPRIPAYGTIEVDLGEIRDGRGLGRDEPDLDVRRQLAHVDPLGDVRQADDDRSGTG